MDDPKLEPEDQLETSSLQHPITGFQWLLRKLTNKLVHGSKDHLE